ncbi:hypothetical protein [Paenibacillus sp. J5C2022]|uniref:hypothetical protein n=1 Tax=Paenibacillus sp. J5C2022 TaxID=2977129 RepID=UPI0021D10669|nr:hypothetical protein [Paenibacillus sp. J5C2022]
MKHAQHMTKILLAAALTSTLLWSAGSAPHAVAAAGTAPEALEAAAPPPTVLNAGFEDPVASSGIPGWSQTFGNGYDSLFYEVTPAQAEEGTHSLLLDDQNAVRPLGIESDPFPVTPGASYSLTSMMNIENGSMALYMRYFDSTGTKVGESSNWLTPTNGQWVKNGTSSIVPANASNATVLIYSSGAGITRGYADDVRIALNPIGTFERIGGIVKGMINEDGAIGTENGRTVMYTVFKGRGEVPTAFAVIDVLTREVLRTHPMPGVEAAWGVKIATDGRVYIGTHYDGGLYRYTPADNSFQYLGRFGEETHVFSLVAGSNGEMYTGTYPSGKLYKFDPVSDSILEIGQFDPTQRYVRSLAYDATRGVLYVGLSGTKARVFKYLEQDGSFTELLASRIPGGGDQYTFTYGLDFANDRLFVKFSNGDLLVMRAEDDTVEYYDPSGMDIHSEKVSPIPGEPGKALFTYSGDYYVYDSATQSSSLLKGVQDGMNFYSGAFVSLNDPAWPGHTFVAVGRYGHILYYNPALDRAEVLPSLYSGAPILIQSIHQGPDGKIYAAGYMSGFTSYDPVTGAVSDTHTLGQVEASVNRNGKMIIGAYAGSRILEYDPALPWSSQNPKQLFDLRAHGQDRPFAMAYAEDRDTLIVGTVPSPDSLEGALALYDFQTEQLDVFKNIVPNQSIISVVYKDGFAYVGTTVYGGLGTDGPTEQHAKLFVFDLATKQKVYEGIPASGRKGVTGLSIGPDGMIWGIAEDYLFKFDPDTFTYPYKASKLRRYKTTGTTWTYGFMAIGADGNMYGTSRGQLFMVKPDTMEFVVLNGTYGNYLTSDAFGNLYFSDNSSDLWKYTPPASEQSLLTHLDIFASQGGIGNHGIANALRTKVEHGELRAFMNQVRAQSGKHITENAAAVLLSQAEQLLGGNA